MIISTGAGEKPVKIHHFHDKNIQQARNRRELPQPDKGHLLKLTANTTVNCERLNTFPEDQQEDTDIAFTTAI